MLVPRPKAGAKADNANARSGLDRAGLVDLPHRSRRNSVLLSRMSQVPSARPAFGRQPKTPPLGITLVDVTKLFHSFLDSYLLRKERAATPNRNATLVKRSYQR